MGLRFAAGFPAGTYRYMDKPPLFHFGSGQSYTTFTTRKLLLQPPPAGTASSAAEPVSSSHVRSEGSGSVSIVRSTTDCDVVNVTVEVSNTVRLRKNALVMHALRSRF